MSIGSSLFLFSLASASLVTAPPLSPLPTFALCESKMLSKFARWAQRRQSEAARPGAARAELIEESKSKQKSFFSLSSSIWTVQ